MYAWRKVFMSIGLEDVYGVTDVLALGVSTFVSLGVTGKVSIWVPGNGDLGVLGVFTSVFPGVFSLGVGICVPGKVSF